MNRRRFLLTSLGGAIAAPLSAGAQQAEKVWRMAWLGDGVDPGPGNVALRPFLEGLRELGYIEGRHFSLERRFAGGSPERLRELAAELVRLKLDLIVAPGTQAILALKAATSSIPILMVYLGDPVGAGIVTSLGRPGGNVTGTSLEITDVIGKCLQVLKELVPTARRVAVLWNPTNAAASAMRSIEPIAGSVGLQMQFAPVDSPARPGQHSRRCRPYQA